MNNEHYSDMLLKILGKIYMFGCAPEELYKYKEKLKEYDANDLYIHGNNHREFFNTCFKDSDQEKVCEIYDILDEHIDVSKLVKLEHEDIDSGDIDLGMIVLDINDMYFIDFYEE